MKFASLVVSKQNVGRVEITMIQDFEAIVIVVDVNGLVHNHRRKSLHFLNRFRFEAQVLRMFHDVF